MPGWFGWCCCGPPCDVTAITFPDGVFTDDSLPVSDTTGWEAADGTLTRTGATAGLLEWERPRDDRDADLVLRIVVLGVNWSTAGGGIHIVVDGVTIALRVDPDTDEVFLEFGSFSEVIGAWSVDGVDVMLLVKATACRTIIRYQIGAQEPGTVSTLQVVFDPLATEYVMGVDGQPGPSEPHPCCEDAARPDSWTISGSQLLGTGGSTITYSGSLVWVEADGWWLGTVTRTGGTSTCTGFPQAVAEVVGTAKITCTGDPLGYEFTFNGTTTASATAECGSATFSVFPLPTTCPAGTVTATAVYSGGTGTPGSQFQNVRLTACGRVPERDCTIVTSCDSCPDGVFPFITVAVGANGAPPTITWELEWDDSRCAWVLDRGPDVTMIVNPDGSGQLDTTLSPQIFHAEDGDGPIDCTDPNGLLVANVDGGTVEWYVTPSEE